MTAFSPTDPDAVGRALSESFPELAPLHVTRVLGAGFNSIAVETDKGLVFRIAKTQGTAERYARERLVLTTLRPRLPVATPEPKWFLYQSSLFPFGVTGYSKLAGDVLTPQLLSIRNVSGLAAQTAEVLLALQRVPLDEIARLGLASHEDRPAHYRSLRQQTSPALGIHTSPAEFARIERWWDSFLADERMLQFTPVLAHGDLWFGNMIVDGTAERLTGIVDWEHAAIADPTLDFSTLLHLGEAFTARVVEAFRAGDGAFGDGEAYRMRRLWELREFYGVLFGIRFHDEAELADSVQKLRAGPIFDGS